MDSFSFLGLILLAWHSLVAIKKWICDIPTAKAVNPEDIRLLATALGASKVASLVIKGAPVPQCPFLLR
jgi:hypothetical protein